MLINWILITQYLRIDVLEMSIYPWLCFHNAAKFCQYVIASFFVRLGKVSVLDRVRALGHEYG